MKIKKIAQNPPKQESKSLNLQDIIDELSKDCYEVSSIDLALLEKNLKKD
jgi:hypothetical protein